MSQSSHSARRTGALATLARRWPLVLVLAVIGAIAGLLVAAALPSTYNATSSVAVTPVTPDGRPLSMGTEAAMVSSPVVTEAAGKSLAPRFDLSAHEVASAIHATPKPDSFVIDITFEADSPELAAAGANALATAYLDTRRATTQASVTAWSAAASAEIDRLKAASGTTDPLSLGARSITTRIDSLSTRLVALGNADLDPGSVIGTAVPPDERSGVSAPLLGAAGALVGLLLGLVLALARRTHDTSIGNADLLAALGVDPVLDGTSDRHPDDTWDIAAILLKIPTELFMDEPFVLMVDATRDRAGNSTATALVAALGRRGRDVRLVDASLVNENKITRGWPTETKRQSWAGELVIIDTTKVQSDAHKMTIAGRSDAVVIARSPGDDAATLRRLVELLDSESVEIALTVLVDAGPSPVLPQAVRAATAAARTLPGSHDEIRVPHADKVPTP